MNIEPVKVTHVAIPQAVFAANFDKPFSALVDQIGSDGIVDAKKTDYALWQARPATLDAEAYKWGAWDGTFKRMEGYAIMRCSHAREFPGREDVACLWRQGF
jgi:hypothetical protein